MDRGRRSNDPFDTDERDELRAEQRRALLEIDNGLCSVLPKPTHCPPSSKVDPVRRPLVELEVRRQAGLLLGKTKELRLQIRDGFVAEEAVRVIHGASFPSSVAEVIDALRMLKPVNDLSLLEDSPVNDLQGAIVLLSIADQLAADYTDPRLISS